VDPRDLVDRIRAGRCALVVGRHAEPAALARLPIAAVWTTRDDDALAGDGRQVIRLLHGLADAAAVRRAWIPPSAARDRVGRVYRDGTLVFVGFRADDVDLGLLLDRLFASFEPPAGPHVFVGDVADRLAEEHAFERVPESFVAALADAFAAAPDVAPGGDDEVDALCARLADDPADADARAALAALAERARSDPERRAEILLARVEVEPDAQARAALLREVAATFAGEPKRARAALLAALREHPGDAAPLADAERLAETDGTWDDLVAELAEVVRDAGDASLWTHLGRLYADKLRHPDYAADSYREALKLDPRRADALRGLAAVQRQKQRWGELADTLTALAELDATPAGWLALGDLFDTSLPRPGAAIDAYERALAVDPTNAPALRALARLYERTQRRDDHLRTLERLSEVVAPVERATLYRRLAAELEDLRDGAPRAAVAYERLLEIEPRAPDAVRALERIWRAEGRWDALARLYDAVLAPDSPAELWHRSGEAQRALGDAGAAEARFARAVARDPGHAPSLLALADLAGARGDLARAVTLLLDAERRAGSRLERAALLWRAAVLRRELGQDAADLAARVLELDPDHLEAGRIVAPIWVDAGRAAEARPLLDMLLRKDASPRWHALYGRAAEQLGDAAAAAEHWGAADGVDATVGLGRALQALGDAAAAETRLREAAAHPLAPAVASDVWRRIAALARARGDAAGAEDALARALAGAGDDRARVLEELGDLRQERGELAGALASYEEGLALRPRHGVLLHKVLDVHTAGKDWVRALAALDRLVEREDDRAVRGEYLYAAARIAEAELDEAAPALAYYQRAVEDGHARALAGVERLAATRGDWKVLGRAYRVELRRNPQNAILWRKLADLLWDELDERDAAIAAHEAAAALEPETLDGHDRLAHLYLEAGPAFADKAIAELQKLLAAAPERDDVYPLLARLYADTGQRDKAYCLSEVLVLLGQAGDEERARAQALRPTALRRFARALDDDDWARLQHPREDRALGGALAAMASALAATVAESRAALKLKEPAGHPLVDYIAAALAIAPAPEVHVRLGLAAPHAVHIDDHGRLVAAVLVPPPAGDIDAAFALAKLYAFLRPERRAIVALGTIPRLEAAVAAARAACGLAQPAGPADKLSARLARSVPAGAREHAAVLFARASADVLGWVAGADLTANRAALLACGSLPVAARAVAVEKGALTSLSARERLLDLVAFAASEEYFGARKRLGIDVGTST
jgi:tetratricopeptide (TPR) repeat protein